MDELKKYRKKIDEVDQDILNTFLERLSIVKEIVRIKKEKGLPIFDEAREKEVIAKRLNQLDNQEHKALVEKFFYGLMDLSKSFQFDEMSDVSGNQLTLGYLGDKGSYSYIAAKALFGSKGLRSYQSFESLFKGLQNNHIKQAILPIENTSTGSILEVYDLLKTYQMHIVGEKNIEINHYLLAKEDSKIEDIYRVYSHPQALKQSKEFLKAYDWELINCENTSAGALKVKNTADKGVAAIGSLEAAKIYGLKVLKERVNYNVKNMTRFIIVQRDEKEIEEANKITLGFSVAHEPGALYQVLGIFENHNINLYKLESRPMIDSPFEYYFYADLAGNLNDQDVQEVLNQVQQKTNHLRIYGNYKRDLGGY